MESVGFKTNILDELKNYDERVLKLRMIWDSHFLEQYYYNNIL